MDEQLKVGDRVRHTTDGHVGNVVEVHAGTGPGAAAAGATYTVKWDGGLGSEGPLARGELQVLD